MPLSKPKEAAAQKKTEPQRTVGSEQRDKVTQPQPGINTLVQASQVYVRKLTSFLVLNWLSISFLGPSKSQPPVAEQQVSSKASGKFSITS